MSLPPHFLNHSSGAPRGLAFIQYNEIADAARAMRALQVRMLSECDGGARLEFELGIWT
jgi:hypothetical protein